MIKKGAILEVKKFIKFKVPKNKSANKAIGIVKIKEYLIKKFKLNQVN
jgi:tRNA A37 N6-isopentenylltransferase MiaA